MMTKKDFIGLANIIQEHKNKLYDNEEGQAILDWIARDLANFCKGQNPLFDRERFLFACGVKK